MRILAQRDAVARIVVAAVTEFVDMRRVNDAAGGDGGQAVPG